MSIILSCFGCTNRQAAFKEFDYKVDRFADMEIIRYQVPGFEDLSLRQKKTGLLSFRSSPLGEGYHLRSELPPQSPDQTLPGGHLPTRRCQPPGRRLAGFRSLP